MFDVGGGELVLIVLAIILLFGPKKIPEIAQTITKGIRKVRQAQQEFSNQVNNISNEAKHPVKTARDQIRHEVDEVKYTIEDSQKKNSNNSNLNQKENQKSKEE